MLRGRWPCSVRAWSWSCQLILACCSCQTSAIVVAHPQNEAGYTHASESRHAEARGEKDATEPAAEVKRQHAAGDTYGRADESAGGRPLQSTGTLTRHVEGESCSEESKERSDCPKIGGAHSEHSRVIAEGA